MSLEEKVQTLKECTQLLGQSYNAWDTLDEGFLLLHKLSSDAKLCEKVSKKLASFGELLVEARNAHEDVTNLLRTRCAMHLEGMNNLKERVEEWSVSASLTELRNLSASFDTMDAKLGATEQVFGRLEAWSRCVDMLCAKHKRAKTMAGGVFLASGCLALTISAATLLIKCAVHTAGAVSSPVADLIFRFSPWNTALAGGIVTAIGFSDACHSQRYSKLTLDFHDFADDLQRELSASRSFRTRIQRLRHAIDDLELSLHVATGIRTVDASTWMLLQEWIPIQDQALRKLDPSHTVP